MSLSYEAVLLANKVRLNETNSYYLLSLFFFLCVYGLVLLVRISLVSHGYNQDQRTINADVDDDDYRDDDGDQMYMCVSRSIVTSFNGFSHFVKTYPPTHERFLIGRLTG